MVAPRALRRYSLVGRNQGTKQRTTAPSPPSPYTFGKSFHDIPYHIIPRQVVRGGEIDQADLEGEGGTGWIQLWDNLIISNRRETKTTPVTAVKQMISGGAQVYVY